MPKPPPASISKRGVTKVVDAKAKGKVEALLPHTIFQPASMSSKSQAADIRHAPSDIRGLERDSGFNSYPPRIPLDKDSNELGPFDSTGMTYDIPSSSLDQDRYANMSTSDNRSNFMASSYPKFKHSSGVRDDGAGTASTDNDMQLCALDSFSFGMPGISNAQARNDLWNGVESASPRLNYGSHGLQTKQASFFNSPDDYVCGGLTTSYPLEPSMGNTFSNPPMRDVQTTAQPLDPASVYGRSHYRKANLVNPTLDPRALPLEDPLTPGTLVGDDESQLSEPSRPSVLNVPSHCAGALPVHVVCRPLHSYDYRRQPRPD